jgi:lysozyme family protein
MEIDKLLDDVLEKEGGYVHHPADRGGPTKHGITQDTLSEWRGRPVAVSDVQILSKDEARQIYRSEYYLKPQIDKLPAIMQPIVFDMAVNNGPKKAVELLQEVVDRMSGKRLEIDGVIGPMTIAACTIAANVYGKDVVRQIVARRRAFYDAIVKAKPSQSVFLKGWLARADSFLA